MGERYLELREALGLSTIESTTEAVFKLRLWEEKPLTSKEKISRVDSWGINLKEPFVCEGSYFIGIIEYLYCIEIHPDEIALNKFHLEYATVSNISSPTVIDGYVQDYKDLGECTFSEDMTQYDLTAIIIGRAFYNLMLYYYCCGECSSSFERHAVDFGDIEVVEKVVRLSNKVRQEVTPRGLHCNHVGAKHTRHSSPRFHIRRYSNGKYVFVGEPKGQIIVQVYKV